MSDQPKDPRYQPVDGEDPETLFITQDETPEAKKRKHEILQKLKGKAGLTFLTSEDETMPGVEVPPEPIDDADDDVEPNSEGDEDDDIEDDDMFFESEAEELAFNESLTKIKPVIKQVVYGFYGLGPEDCITDSVYQMMPNDVFRAEYIIVFPLEYASIEYIKCGNVDQLVTDKPVPASEFRCEYTLDLMIDRYFDAQSVKPNGIVHLAGVEIDGRGHGRFSMLLETVAPGTNITIKFNGKLRGLLIIGAERIAN